MKTKDSFILTVKLAAQLMKTTTDEAADLEPKGILSLIIHIIYILELEEFSP